MKRIKRLTPLLLTNLVGVLLPLSATRAEDRPRNIGEARLCVTGADHNRPASFPGLGDFVGWPGGVERMPNGDLLLVHSAGYWHSSFEIGRAHV